MAQLLHGLRRRSIAAQAIAPLVMIMLGVTLLVSALAYHLQRERRADEVMAGLKAANQLRMTAIDEQFSAIRTLQLRATDIFERNLAQMPHGDVDRLFDRLFPLRADGTRRSLPGLFEGMAIGSGDSVYGVGAFLARGASLTREEKREFLAAFHVVRSVRSERIGIKNFYFFTPRSRLVIFAPARQDRLTFYRETAPATLDLSSQQPVQMLLPANNPDRLTRCTSLQPIAYDVTGHIWTTGCMTPVYRHGRLIGGWGNSILLEDLVERFARNAANHMSWALISADGRLIFHPRYTRQNDLSTAANLDLAKAKDPELRRLWSIIRTGAVPLNGAVRSDRLGAYLSVARTNHPGWYSITSYPTAIADQSAKQAALLVLVLGLSLTAVQTILMASLLRRHVSDPLAALTSNAYRFADAIKDTEKPTLDFSLPTHREDEVGRLARAFDAMAVEVWEARGELEQRVAMRTRQLSEANSALQDLARTDSLTSLANRREFLDRLDAAINEAAWHGSPFIVALFDIDHFKRVNDNHGHPAGDAVLCAVANTMMQACRASDLVGRLGGEEFAMLLKGLDAEDGYRVLDRVRQSVRDRDMELPNGRVLRVTVSAGLAQWRTGEAASDLLSRCDAALYQAKGSGRDRLQLAA